MLSCGRRVLELAMGGGAQCAASAQLHSLAHTNQLLKAVAELPSAQRQRFLHNYTLLVENGLRALALGSTLAVSPEAGASCAVQADVSSVLNAYRAGCWASDGNAGQPAPEQLHLSYRTLHGNCKTPIGHMWLQAPQQPDMPVYGLVVFADDIDISTNGAPFPDVVPLDALTYPAKLLPGESADTLMGHADFLAYNQPIARDVTQHIEDACEARRAACRVPSKRNVARVIVVGKQNGGALAVLNSMALATSRHVTHVFLYTMDARRVLNQQAATYFREGMARNTHVTSLNMIESKNLRHVPRACAADGLVPHSVALPVRSSVFSVDSMAQLACAFECTWASRERALASADFLRAARLSGFDYARSQFAKDIATLRQVALDTFHAEQSVPIWLSALHTSGAYTQSK